MPGKLYSFQVGLHKDSKNKTNPTRITTGQTSLAGRPDRSARSAADPAKFWLSTPPSSFYPILSFNYEPAQAI